MTDLCVKPGCFNYVKTAGDSFCDLHIKSQAVNDKLAAQAKLIKTLGEALETELPAKSAGNVWRKSTEEALAQYCIWLKENGGKK